MSTSSLLNCFLSGLRDDIQREFSLLQPESLHDAIGMAKLVEDKCNAARFTSGPLRFFTRPPVLASHTSASPQTQLRTNQPGHSIPIKRLSPTEMAARRERGLCYNCDSPFTKGHRCNPAQFLCLLVDDENQALEEICDAETSPPQVEPDPPPDTLHPAEVPCLSFHALTGMIVPC